ncbi:putative transmembrane protein PGPGW [Mesorhizobium sp. J18]|uniref:hypothetical protein n=1 Tax=Mesorhizobium sp. J18 TaxID=935263 RepID=UPI00119A7CBE|nr:hypothetical protein [Mesorhizobium sp. J18]TWG95527.1 putative transmembrane protein PGPGW [Mesorhizobium sp. J18]
MDAQRHKEPYDLRSSQKPVNGTDGPSIQVFGRRIPMPRSRLLRILIGVLFIILGCFGFLPVLGFWMIPVGLLILSYEFAAIRRLRRRVSVWWGRRNGK